MALSTTPSNGAVRRQQSIVLTATASQDVGPTPYYIEIDDVSAGLLVLCATGTTCSTTVVHDDPSYHQFSARITDLGGVVPAVSNVVVGTWIDAVVLFEFNTSGQQTVMAVSNLDVGPTPWWLSLWRFNGGQPVLLAVCAAGSECGRWTLVANGESYAAVVSNESSTWSGLTDIRAMGGWYGIG